MLELELAAAVQGSRNRRPCAKAQARRIDNLAAPIEAPAEAVIGLEIEASPAMAAPEVPALSAVAGPPGRAQGAAVHAELPVWVEAVREEAEAGDADADGEERTVLMKFNFHRSVTCFVWMVGILSGAAAMRAQTEGASSSSSGSLTAPQSFATPRQAADALIASAQSDDVNSLLRIFGPEGKDLVSSSDPVRDKQYIEAFAAKAQEKTKIEADPNNPSRAVLAVGNDDWPMPVPLVRTNGKWHFDAKQGRNEVLYRRIGANELDAIQICRGFVEAQKQYSSQIHDNSGINEYAQKIISSPGKHDGLYWQNSDGSSGGPIGEVVARAISEGYSANEKSGYHGYYFKVLKGQGPAAPLGQLDYVIGGVMIGGFALAAVPVEYRVTGVKTFIVSYDGVVYEKDLGPDSLQIVQGMDRYNPDSGWKPSRD